MKTPTWEQLVARYECRWEFDRLYGYSAVRKHGPSREAEARGQERVLLADSVAELAIKLRKQEALMGPFMGELPVGFFDSIRPASSRKPVNGVQRSAPNVVELPDRRAS
ncbi:hypothetical protein [Bailinhaonella thermotolerans]|uniref:Uncharacterized protein n=1 Tax=Bailinhaonella thermotolerans TaxID=1070861 RepID=A0A3A4AV25_9ACTN|nr:hypothetical protein [Bailinhaonella thermotolerans]RJL29937.1 hypothetical protein D5H75_23580 [Bailinhaonella thermotolerans]